MDAAFTTGISYTSEKINKQCKNSLRLLLKKTYSDIKRVFFLMWQIPKVKLVTKLNQMQISKSN